MLAARQELGGRLFKSPDQFQVRVWLLFGSLAICDNNLTFFTFIYHWFIFNRVVVIMMSRKAYEMEKRHSISSLKETSPCDK